MYRRALTKMSRWLEPREVEPRRAMRSEPKEMVVFCWNGAAPAAQVIRDISRSGAYIYTPDRWYVGTIMRLVIQRADIVIPGDVQPRTLSTCIPARVVRHGTDGLGVEFYFATKQNRVDFGTFLATVPEPARHKPARRVGSSKGQALVEFALIVPLVFILAVNAINVGGFVFSWITVAGAARSGGNYMVMSKASTGGPTAATSTQVSSMVVDDTASLMNRSSIVVATCTNKTTASNACTTLTDPEAPSFTLATVDVTYTYKPYISAFNFPGLSVTAYLPSGSVHRKVVMRMLQ